MTASPQPLTYVVGDVHGYLDKLTAALQAHSLVDLEGNWSGGTATVWFLGDFVDRGPDGIGVIDLVRKLAQQAPSSGGAIHTVLGNHEILLLGTYHFGDGEVLTSAGLRSFARSWLINGGKWTDQQALNSDHIDWLSQQPFLALTLDHLLMHSDTLEYFHYGSTVEQINHSLAEILVDRDLAQWWDLFHRTTTRYAFRGPGGEENATKVLQRLGGQRIVHGHSVIADQLGIHPSEVERPYLYAQNQVLGVDGGTFVGGPCLVVPLPWEPAD